MSGTRNLKLAWMYLKTGQNVQYRKYYKGLFLAYELRQEENIKRLSERLRGRSYRPSNILRFYQPKSSGLQRPITFLHLDDLIVYQALVNVVAKKFSKARRDVEFKNVFSNILNRDKTTEIFFLRKWQESYGAFIKRIKKYYKERNIWVAHFDLAAHYDTIDHEALAEQVSRGAHTDFTDFLKECLRQWSTHKKQKLNHGIPQGPVASGFLAEIHMLPIDKRLGVRKVKYVRYGDDIRIFGKSKIEVLQGVVLLEGECKERGLIPQSKKYEVVKATSVEEAVGKFPSLQQGEKDIIPSDPEETYQLFTKAFDEKNFDISRVRYILKVSGKNEKILDIVLRNLDSHPDLVDEFCQFLSNHTDEERVGKKIYASCIQKPFPYEYVEGKYWELLSYFPFQSIDKQPMVETAIQRLKKSRDKYALKRGIYIFLCSTETSLVLSWLGRESSSLIQAMVVPYIPKKCMDEDKYRRLYQTFRRRSNYEPAVVAISELIHALKFDILNRLNPATREESGVVNNLLGTPEEIDSIGQITRNRYGIQYYRKWKGFLGKDYNHANTVLVLGDRAYYIDKSVWVNYTDTFNDILVRKLISFLCRNNPAVRWPKTKGSNGKNVDYGVILDRDNQLSRQFPGIVDGFRSLHDRRVVTPVSHAYQKKTAGHTSSVNREEQKELHRKLKVAYEELIRVL